MLFRQRLLSTLLCSCAALISGCSGGSGSSGAAGGGLQLTATNVSQGAVWEINRVMEFTFSAAVDFSTVSLNTINVQTLSGAPAAGSFSFKSTDLDGDGIPEIDRRTVVFQPNCPTRDDLADAGLRPGGVVYSVRLLGASSGAVHTVRSTTGARLGVTQTRTIATPISTDPSSAFIDTVNGPPVPVIRNAGSASRSATYIEVGGDGGSRVYFEFDGQDIVTEVPGFESPLNLYSAESSRVTVVVEFNQPVSPRAENISPGRLGLEFQDGSGTWRALDTRVILVRNCSTTGATVRLEALGIIPEASRLRAVVRENFQDLAQGEATGTPIADFAVVPTRTVDFAGLDPPGLQADELLEEFAVGGTGTRSFEDADAVFATSRAVWGGGELRAGFNFEGSGGPNGDFDVVVRSGQTLLFDTLSTVVIGGPGGDQVRQQTAVNGILDVRNLIIEEGGFVRAEGPNPFVINASGRVEIDGILDVSGFDAPDVRSLRSANLAEPGGKGACGGGDGGDASIVSNNSTPKGEDGDGAFGLGSAGGRGGEANSLPVGSSNEEDSRPAGGGGGRFAPSQIKLRFDGSELEQNYRGEAGNPGICVGVGAISNPSFAQGGEVGPTAFTDDVSGVQEGNDFFGVRALPNPVDPETPILVRGELSSIRAGSGGGAAGDGLRMIFPPVTWSPADDKKGGGGGGGGGALNIRSLGPIVFGPKGTILARGGEGADGESTLQASTVGGSGGGGSGGHVVLESAVQVDFAGGDGMTPTIYEADPNGDGVVNESDYIVRLILPEGGRLWTYLRTFAVDARGGFGGLVGTAARHPFNNDGVDPNTGCVLPSVGGAGGPGIIQIHVPDPLEPISDAQDADIRVPSIRLADDSVVPIGDAADPLGEVAAPPAISMVPIFSSTSRARSRWISIGGADQSRTGGTKPVTFGFGGVETAAGEDQGKILVQSGDTVELPPLLGPEAVGTATVFVSASDPATLVVQGTSLDPLTEDDPMGERPPNDVYLRTPALLRNFTLRVETVSGNDEQDFNVVSASFDDENRILAVTVDPFGGTPGQFAAAAGEPVLYTLIPRYFRVVTGGARDRIPGNGYVRILFEATGATAQGLPDTGNLLVPLTGDVRDLNAVPQGTLKFFRFQVELHLGDELTANTSPITLDYLRIPFSF